MPPQTLEDEIAASESAGSGPRRMLARFRAHVEHRPRLRLAYRLTVAVVGTAIILVGIALLVLPGPGWLMIFLGLGILGSEFRAAQRLNTRLKRLVLRAWHWWRDRRHRRS
ncbi:PGPGW domain-containing protein [Cellulomonas hominis]